jgi:hypothetical protein
LIRQYQDRFGWKDLGKYPVHHLNGHSPGIHRARLHVVIPGYDEPDTVSVINSLSGCDAPPCPVDVVCVFNAPENCGDAVVQRTFEGIEALREFASATGAIPPWMCLRAVEAMDLPARKAGVGLARKIGLDLVCSELRGSPGDHILVCLDMDCTVHSSYLVAIDRHFCTRSDAVSASIHYEHRWPSDESAGRVRAILEYEIHLRLYTNLIRSTGLPYGYHTVGSSMAVRADEYCRQGGMNTRKAGEDFYFLQKFMKTGRHSRLQDTCVHPSARVSHRVPFGTGRAMAEMARDQNDPGGFLTYPPHVFSVLGDFAGRLVELSAGREISDIAQAPHLRDYLEMEGFPERLASIRERSASAGSLIRNLHHELDAFWIMKWANHSVTTWTRRCTVSEALDEWAGKGDFPEGLADDPEAALMFLRDHDRRLPFRD